jgi:hypothetical protein
MLQLEQDFLRRALAAEEPNMIAYLERAGLSQTPGNMPVGGSATSFDYVIRAAIERNAAP